ncbi:hypothetical protein EVAR_74590_1 [Eumeta japonica]|uniref:Uncharacterized protein n=1 Tax=Eumeta variegata TaxID=151549 RepID=A0A4C1TEY7_EUMVA|nr:hypothetical protein EVAR_74590_1 [Eumeta japonica]
MGRHKEAGIDQNTSMHIARPPRATCVRRRERKVVRCGRVLAYKIERTRKRSFANSRKRLASLLESHIDPSARIASGAVRRLASSILTEIN